MNSHIDNHENPLKGHGNPAKITTLKGTMTLRWEDLEHTLVLWFSQKSPIRNWSRENLAINDFWIMAQYESIFATCDRKEVPSWFKLHGTDLTHFSLAAALRSAQSGMLDTQPTGGPDVWRVRAGDRIAVIHLFEDWVEVVMVDRNALFIAETTDPLNFAIKQGQRMSLLEKSHHVETVRAAVDSVLATGRPRIFSESWSLL